MSEPQKDDFEAVVAQLQKVCESECDWTSSEQGQPLYDSAGDVYITESLELLQRLGRFQITERVSYRRVKGHWVTTEKAASQ
jgi:hypothetical protein